MFRSKPISESKKLSRPEENTAIRRRAAQLLNEGLVLHRKGDLIKAKTLYESALHELPDYVDALILLGVLETQSKDYLAAAAMIEHAIKINPNSATAYYNYGISLIGLGRLQDAIVNYDKAIFLKPNFVEAYSNRGNALRALNRFNDAIASYDMAIAIKPDYPEAHNNRGITLKLLNRLSEAISSYDEAIVLKRDYAEAYNNRGNTFAELGQFDMAIENYDAAIALNPRYADAYLNRANVLLKLHRFNDVLINCDVAIARGLEGSDLHNFRGIALAALSNFSDALSSYNKAIELRPHGAEAYNNRGLALAALNQFDQALASYNVSLSIKPHYAEAFNNRGNLFLSMNIYGKALDDFNIAIALKTGYADAYNNRGNSFLALNQPLEAVNNYDKAIALKPNFADAYNNRGLALVEEMQMLDAIASFEMAICINTDFADAYWNKALALLTVGNFREGWELYEWRWKKNDTVANRLNFSAPLWLGREPLNQKTILLHSEQGLGDTIQFCRYVKLVKALGARVILLVPKPLMRLLEGLSDVDVVLGQGSTLPKFDYYCPLMSLPFAFKTSLETVPCHFPYLTISENKVNEWKAYIGNSGFKIAICWQGKAEGRVDIGKSFRIDLFEGISKIKGVRLISLQKNFGVAQLDELPAGMKVERLPSNFDENDNAFIDSAAVMHCVDLIITNDTSLTHLGGALGLKTWLPLKYVPDWRWMLHRNDSPWYPNHRLFRQKKPDAWDEVFEEMKNQLNSQLSLKLDFNQ